MPGMDENEFDLLGELDRTLKVLGLSRDPAVSEIAVSGSDPLVPSTIRLGSAMGIALLSAAVGAAQIWQAGTGRPQRLALDLGQAMHQITPYLGGGNTLNGYGSNMGSVLGRDGTPMPALWDLYRTADDRWVIPIACYARSRDEFTALLNTAHTREHFAAAIARWNAWELEEAAARGSAAGRRPQQAGVPRPPSGAGRAGRATRLGRAHRRRPAAPPAGGRTATVGPAQPPVHPCLRGHGGRRSSRSRAGLLHAASRTPSTTTCCGTSRCWHAPARLDVRRDSDGRRTFDQLLRTTDVFVHNHRASKMDRLGLGPQECAEISPGSSTCRCAVTATAGRGRIAAASTSTPRH